MVPARLPRQYSETAAAVAAVVGERERCCCEDDGDDAEDGTASAAAADGNASESQGCSRLWGRPASRQPQQLLLQRMKKRQKRASAEVSLNW